MPKFVGETELDKRVRAAFTALSVLENQRDAQLHMTPLERGVVSASWNLIRNFINGETYDRPSMKTLLREEGTSNA